MSRGQEAFCPMEPLLPGQTDPRCCAVIVIPARNEEAVLPRCLDALAGQVDERGRPWRPFLLETLLLLNNCSDRSAAVVHAWHEQHPEFVLHLEERQLPVDQAHVGTARRWLLDTAWHRLHTRDANPGALLSTDADTVVAPDWIAQNLAALRGGADVVGGTVEIVQEELEEMPVALRDCYLRDRRYAALIAQLEDRLDPQVADPWPRHLDHFGSSLACTTAAYAAAGGMPAARTLEDEAFVDRVRRAGLKLRHEPRVRVYTSARIVGRAPVGMAEQLRRWGELTHAEEHQVSSGAFLAHRFRTLRRLREIFELRAVSELHLATPWWKQTFAEALAAEPTYPDFLSAVYCDVLIQESFEGSLVEPIEVAIEALESLLATEEAVSR